MQVVQPHEEVDELPAQDSYDVSIANTVYKSQHALSHILSNTFNLLFKYNVFKRSVLILRNNADLRTK